MIRDFDPRTNQRLGRALSVIRRYINDNHDASIIARAAVTFDLITKDSLPEMREIVEGIAPENHSELLAEYVSGIEDEVEKLERRARIIYGLPREGDLEEEQEQERESARNAFDGLYSVTLSYEETVCRNQLEELLNQIREYSSGCNNTRESKRIESWIKKVNEVDIPRIEAIREEGRPEDYLVTLQDYLFDLEEEVKGLSKRRKYETD